MAPDAPTLGFEPTHLRGGSGLPIDGAVTDDLPHHRVVGQPLGIIDVLVPREAAIDSLSEQTLQPVEAVRAFSGVGQRRSHQIGQAESVVQLPHDEQTSVGTEL